MEPLALIDHMVLPPGHVVAARNRSWLSVASFQARRKCSRASASWPASSNAMPWTQVFTVSFVGLNFIELYLETDRRLLSCIRTAPSLTRSRAPSCSGGNGSPTLVLSRARAARAYHRRAGSPPAGVSRPRGVGSSTS